MQSTQTLLTVLNGDRLMATNDTLFSAERGFQTLRPLLRNCSLAADLFLLSRQDIVWLETSALCPSYE